MALVNGHQLIKVLEEENMIGGAFNTTTLETTIGILEAIEKSGVPSFIQVAPTNVTYSGYDYIFDMVNRYAKNMNTPVALHLDHGKKFSDVKKAVLAGFTSVMIDGAEYDFETNIKITKEVVDYCKQFNIPVEAELGAIGGKEDDLASENELKTNPEQVLEFVERTGCDILAVSVGNVHGLDDDPEIDSKLLEKLSNISPVPLVIHGGSGIPNEDIKKIAKNNVVKLNIAGELRKAFIETVGLRYTADTNEHNLIGVLTEAKDAVTNVVYNKIIQLNPGVENIE